MGVLFFVLTWSLLSLPIGMFVGRIFAEMGDEAVWTGSGE